MLPNLKREPGGSAEGIATPVKNYDRPMTDPSPALSELG
jgi:hypothetical protein